MNWPNFWRQLFTLSTRVRVRPEDRYRMKRLVRELRRDEQLKRETIERRSSRKE